jgi:hypothetical protein
MHTHGEAVVVTSVVSSGVVSSGVGVVSIGTSVGFPSGPAREDESLARI